MNGSFQEISPCPSAFLLSSALSSYPDDSFRDRVRLLLDDQSVDASFSRANAESWQQLKTYLLDIISDEESVRDLRSLYVDIFERGRPANSLYGSEYGIGRSIAKGQDLLEVTSYYKAFGFELSDDPASREMVDHLGVELEFYGLLKLKSAALEKDDAREGVEIVEDAKKRFMTDHLGGFVAALLQRSGVLSNSFYFHTMQCIEALVRQECTALGVEPASKSWHEDMFSSEDEITCGSVGCLSGNPNEKVN